MYTRCAFGLAILIWTTSCVGTATGSGPGAPRIAASAATPALPVAAAAPTVLPAAPPAALLAAMPPTVAGFAGPTVAPPFIAAVANADAAGRALDCLTQAVYYEARSEPVEGQEAVAQVVLNRVRNPAFPNSVCGTVYEGGANGGGCQFTFTCDGSMLVARREPAAWERARQVAQQALSGFVYAPVGAATYYHTTAIHAWWDAKVLPVAVIGAHVFFRLPGAWGGTLAFDQAYGGVEPAPAIAASLPEKATDGYLQSIEASVMVHRGGDLQAASAAATASPADPSAPAVPPVPAATVAQAVTRFGVTVHHGDADASAAAPATVPASDVDMGGVHVHRAAG